MYHRPVTSSFLSRQLAKYSHSSLFLQPHSPSPARTKSYSRASSGRVDPVAAMNLSGMERERARDAFQLYAKMEPQDVMKAVQALDLKISKEELINLIDMNVDDGSARPNYHQYLKIVEDVMKKINEPAEEPPRRSAREVKAEDPKSFLKSHGLEDRRIDLMLERMELKGDPMYQSTEYWRGLWEKYGDFGGNVQLNGVVVRTPYAGPPPEHWSGGDAGHGARKEYIAKNGRGVAIDPSDDDDDEEEY